MAWRVCLSGSAIHCRDCLHSVPHRRKRDNFCDTECRPSYDLDAVPCCSVYRTRKEAKEAVLGAILRHKIEECSSSRNGKEGGAAHETP